MSAVPQASDGPLLLRPSPWRWLMMIAIGVGFVAGGFFLLDVNPWIGGACIFFFGACAALGIVNLLPGASHLRLDADGFEMRSLSRSHRIAWRDVAGFGATQIALTRMVGWNFVDGYRDSGRLRRLNAGLCGFEAALPDTYGHKPKALADMMETWRLRAARQPPPLP